MPTAQHTATTTVPAAVDLCAQNDRTIVPVWVHWLAIGVFIAGTEKAIVELTAAFLLNDISTLRQISKELGIDPSLMFGEQYACLTYTEIAEIAFETQSIHQLTREKLVELIKKGGKCGRKAVQRYFSDLFRERDKKHDEKDNRSKRGEHVINNGVINVYRDIINEFLHRNDVTRHGIADTRLFHGDYQTSRDCYHYFSTDTKTSIQHVLKVYIDKHTVYIDANAFLYGRAIQVLKKAAVDHMMELYSYPLNKGTRQTRPLKEIVKTINDKLSYVDQHALSIWLARNRQPGRDTYERAQIAVHCMFDEIYEKLRQWVNEAKRAGY